MFAIRAARLFDGVSNSLLRHPTVTVDGARIAHVLESPPPDSGTGVVDLGDVTLLPGLIDAHQHLVFDASNDPVAHLAGRDGDQVRQAARLAARTALAAGITTARDLGDRDSAVLPLRDEFTRDPTAGPELPVSGPPMTSYGGHCWFLGGEVGGVDRVREAVRVRAERGVDAIKVMVTGGALTKGSANHIMQFAAAELAAIADEAHGLGLTVTGHAKCAEGMAAAVAAGFDGIEHALFLTPQPDRAVVDAIAAAGLYVSITAARKPPPEPTERLLEIEDAFAVMRAAGYG